MIAKDIIYKKRHGGAISQDEINFLITGMLDETIPAYQISAFLMAVFFNGMNSEETGRLTTALINSGQTLSLAAAHAPYVDKHSTGGVGDGTSLVIAPLLAACGLHIPMMSGRALGHTGGTLDKLDSIPHYQTRLLTEQFVQTVEKYGYAMCGQTADLAPADQYLYALRDASATVESIPLITSSILSKKFAEGVDILVLDVKCGRGAFASDLPFAHKLAQQLIETGRYLRKTLRAVITDMDQPLGIMIGNFLEIEQAAVVLRGYDNELYQPAHLQDFTEVLKYLSAQVLIGADKASDMDAAMQLIDDALSSGSAWECFCQNVAAQGGDLQQLQQMFGRRRARHVRHIRAQQAGYLQSYNAYTFGIAASRLGVGRQTVKSAIDTEAGIQLCKKAGERIAPDDLLCILYANDESTLAVAEQMLVQSGIDISADPPPARESLIIKTILGQ